jgi:hypothetical protein
MLQISDAFMYETFTTSNRSNNDEGLKVEKYVGTIEDRWVKDYGLEPKSLDMTYRENHKTESDVYVNTGLMMTRTITENVSSNVNNDDESSDDDRNPIPVDNNQPDDKDSEASGGTTVQDTITVESINHVRAEAPTSPPRSVNLPRELE